MSTELNHNHNFLLYTNSDGVVKVDVLLKDETIWLSINQMAALFGIDKSGVSRHIKNIFETGELQEELVVAKIATTTQHGAMEDKTQTKTVTYFNLDMIVSVGYCVNSIRGTHFRIWATKQLKELIIKGFVLDNNKLKNPDNPFDKDYIVTMYLDHAELQAKSHKQMFMKDWREKLDVFLQFNEQEILTNAGKIQKRVADKLAENKYEGFHKKRLESEANQLGDIDQEIKKLKISK